jgi:hypothetical protein
MNFFWVREAEVCKSNFIFDISYHFVSPTYANAVEFLVQIHLDSIWTYKHMHLNKLKILRKLLYYLKRDKTGYTPFRFLGPKTLRLLVHLLLHLVYFSRLCK